jgi:hypothetical protein
VKTTLILTVEEEMAEFIRNQPGMVDPSAFINKLFHDDMARKSITLDPRLRSSIRNDEVKREAELFLDENTHAAG